MRSITPAEHRHHLYLSVYQQITWISIQTYFFGECAKKAAVGSEFRECAKATGSQKSVASWSRWPYCFFNQLKKRRFYFTTNFLPCWI